MHEHECWRLSATSCHGSSQSIPKAASVIRWNEVIYLCSPPPLRFCKQNMELLDEHARNNYAILRDCLSEPIILKSAPASRSAKGRKPKGRKTSLANPVSDPPTSPSNDTSDDAADLADFIDVKTPLPILDSQSSNPRTPKAGLLIHY